LSGGCWRIETNGNAKGREGEDKKKKKKAARVSTEPPLRREKKKRQMDDVALFFVEKRMIWVIKNLKWRGSF